MFRYAVPSLLLATGVTALPAVQDDDSLNYSNTTAGWTPVNVTTDYLDLQVGGDSSVSTASVDAAAAYDLVASYTSSNWFDSFAVQALGVRRSLHSSIQH